MPTTLQTLIDRARQRLIEPTPRFWSDAELLAIVSDGVKDLWKAVKSVNLNYVATLNTTSVSLGPGTDVLSGVPEDVTVILGIEPVSPAQHRELFFRPLSYFDPRFQAARQMDAVDPRSRTIWYDIFGQGAPIAAPTIRVAPRVTSSVSLQLGYVPAVDVLTTASINPMPGETDNAVVAWTVAYARAKEREDRSPDPEWLAIYATDKANLVTSVLPPRQEDELQVVDGLFEDY